MESESPRSNRVLDVYVDQLQITDWFSEDLPSSSVSSSSSSSSGSSFLTEYLVGAYASDGQNSTAEDSLSSSSVGEEDGAMDGPPVRHYEALLLLVFPLLTAFGNVLVCVSVCSERSLQTVTNYFIVSLAVADIMVAILVMPLAVYVEVNDSIWNLSDALCDTWIAFDVMSCTASILNLTAISVDRFTAVTRPISYAKQKRSRRVYVLIAIPWTISFAISLPIALGMNYTDRRLETPTLCTFYNSDFLIYSSMGSFYIPCLVMTLLYWRIYLAIRSRTRRRGTVVGGGGGDQRQQLQAKTGEARALNGTYGNHGAVEEETRREEEEEEEEEEGEEEEEEEEEDIIKDEVVRMVNGEMGLRGGLLLPFSTHYATQRQRMSSMAQSDGVAVVREEMDSEDAEAGGEDDADDDDDDDGTTELELTPEKAIVMLSEKVLLLPVAMTTSSVNNVQSTVSDGDYLLVRDSSDTERTQEPEPDAFNDGRITIPRITIQSISSTQNSPSEMMTIQNSGYSSSPHGLSSLAANWICEGDRSRSCKRMTSLRTVQKGSNRQKRKKTGSRHGPRRVDFTELSTVADPGLATDSSSLVQMSRRESSFVQFSTKFSFSSGQGQGQGHGQGHGQVSAVGLSTNLARRKRAAKREKKATKTLAIVLGVFLLCWMPFFTVNIINAICLRYDLFSRRQFCHIPSWLFSFLVWLGYINSFLNPVIYTIFNAEFRRAFRKILHRIC